MRRLRTELKRALEHGRTRALSCIRRCRRYVPSCRHRENVTKTPTVLRARACMWPVCWHRLRILRPPSRCCERMRKYDYCLLCDTRGLPRAGFRDGCWITCCVASSPICAGRMDVKRAPIGSVMCRIWRGNCHQCVRMPVCIETPVGRFPAKSPP